MDLTSITSADFKRLATLLQLKETLKAQITGIDQELASVGSGNSASPARRGRKPGRPAKTAKPPKAPKAKGTRQKRGQLKESIVALLKDAGKEGLSVKDISTKLKVKPANIHVWFGSTGKKIKEIKKEGNKRVWVG